MKILFTDWSRHIYIPSIGWEWYRPDAYPYLGQVPLPRWASPRWAQEFHNHGNMVGRAGRAIKSPVGGVTLKLFQAGSSFVLEVPLSLEHHKKYIEKDEKGFRNRFLDLKKKAQGISIPTLFAPRYMGIQ